MLLGEVFMRHYFTAFKREESPKEGQSQAERANPGKSYIGFAKAKLGEEPTKRLSQLAGAPGTLFTV